MNWPAPIDLQTVAGIYKIPDIPNIYVKQITITAILNAWDAHAFIDCYGHVWVNSKGCRIILRTSTNNAKYLIGRLPDNEKSYFGNEIFIKGPAICKILDDFCYAAGSLNRENYIKYSQCVYDAIKHSDTARVSRAQNYDRVKEIIGKLKSQRIRQFSIQHDELTGEILITNSQFSHIRSVAAFPDLSTYIENGLIVNASTHDVITGLGISDEVELISLCRNKEWNIDWIYSYQQFLGSPIN